MVSGKARIMKQLGTLLLIDDDRHVLTSMAEWLSEIGFQTDTAGSFAEGMAAINNKSYDLALVDVCLGEDDGFDILKHCRENCPETSVIMISGYGTAKMAVDAIHAGAFDFLTKPLIDDELEMSIERALSQRKVIEENESLKQQLDKQFGMENIVGCDHRMLKVFDVIDSVADSKTTVLITGESGTGKSLVARAIHRRSPRRDKPFVEVACGALPETLLESELFGHAAGAFTGAIGNKVGKFMLADGGTIFLDEVATASPAMQVKLLRVLQDFEFEQVGGTETFKIDARVVLATNENLSKAVAEGRFRQDLFYRINVINVELPTLRERISDISLLAEHFLAEIREDAGKTVHGFTDEALLALGRYRWPGNVRELQNVIERAVLLGKSDMIGVEDLPRELAVAAPYNTETSGCRSLKEALEGPERQIIREVLEANGWNRHATAEALDINRTTLYKKMKRLGLDQPQAAMAR